MDRVDEILPFIRFAVVGLVSNGVLFALYLAMTALGIDHKVAATLVYGIGIVQTFHFNRAWSFRDGGARGPAFLRYVVTYLVGYVLNMALLVLFVDILGYRHELVQGILVLTFAVALFVLQKSWVFRNQEKGPT